jgi:hypothetical protein
MSLRIVLKSNYNIINVIEKHYCWKVLILPSKMDLWFNLPLKLEIHHQEQRKNSTKRYLLLFQKIKFKAHKQNLLLQYSNKTNLWKEAMSRSKPNKKITFNQLTTLILHMESLD